MRQIDLRKIPRPDFEFSEFQHWRKSELNFVIEIGCGVGRHPLTWAAAHPNEQILAIERTHEKFTKFKTRLENHRTKYPGQYQNIWAAHAEASVLLPHLLSENSVSQFFHLYPNPEPKAKNRRLAHNPLLPFIFKTLLPNGCLTVASNIKSYIDELRSTSAEIGFIEFSSGPISFSTPPRSHFEKKYLARGETCYEIILQKP
jgi:tRNA G46 methylase TrmB